MIVEPVEGEQLGRVTRLSIVRHGQTEWNRQQRIQGSTDIPLNSIGRAQAAEAGVRLRERDWDLVVSSPLVRAEETARIIAGELCLPRPLVDPNMTERHHGEMEGLTFTERQKRFPDGVPVPGLETRQQVLDRVLPALARLAENYEGQSLLVISHGGIIGTLLRHFTSGERPRHDEIIANGSVHDFEWRSGRIELTNFDATLRTVNESFDVLR